MASLSCLPEWGTDVLTSQSPWSTRTQQDTLGTRRWMTIPITPSTAWGTITLQSSWGRAPSYVSLWSTPSIRRAPGGEWITTQQYVSQNIAISHDLQHVCETRPVWSFQGYMPKQNRIIYSGPLMPPGGNMEEMLKEHDRQIQVAVRKAQLDKIRSNVNIETNWWETNLQWSRIDLLDKCSKQWTSNMKCIWK